MLHYFENNLFYIHKLQCRVKNNPTIEKNGNFWKENKAKNLKIIKKKTKNSQ